MSIENAILVHATALDNLAAVLSKMINTRSALAIGMQELDAVQNAAAVDASTLVRGNTAAEQSAVRSADKDPNPQAVAKGDAEVEQAVAKVEQAAKQETKQETKVPADTPAEAAPDYIKDVRPVLLAAVKKVGKAEVEKLIASFGVDKGDKVPADKMGELLAGAKKLAA